MNNLQCHRIAVFIYFNKLFKASVVLPARLQICFPVFLPLLLVNKCTKTSDSHCLENFHARCAFVSHPVAKQHSTPSATSTDLYGIHSTYLISAYIRPAQHTARGPHAIAENVAKVRPRIINCRFRISSKLQRNKLFRPAANL